MRLNFDQKAFEKIFYFSLIGLFICFGFNFGAYFFLYSSAILGTGLLAHYHYNKEITISKYFWIPVLFILYVSITPGEPFKDLRIGGMMAAAFASGVAAYFFFKDRFSALSFFLPMALVAYFLAYGLWTLTLEQPFFPVDKYPGRLTLSFSHPNVLGEMASLGILLLLCFPAERKIWRWTGYGLVAVLGFMIVLTVGRSTYLGILAALSLYSIIKHGKKSIAVILIFLTLGIISLPFLPKNEQQRLSNTIKDPLNDPTFKSRLPMWIAAIDGFKESPLIGKSVRGFKKFHAEYIDMNYEELQTRLGYETEKKAYSHPHNAYLAALHGWGLIGCSIIFAMFIHAIYISLRIKDYFAVYAIMFMLAYGVFDVRFQSKTGDLFLFFPLGTAYASLLAWRRNELKSDG
jgi:O-antigen ligase